MSKKNETDNYKVAAQNKRARFDYQIIEELEVGIVLTGSEVKSIRQGKISIAESHAGEMNGELYLFNANILEYTQAHQFNYEPKRPRKLLLHRKERNKFLNAIRKKGMTIIPLVIYFNHKGMIKLKIALGKGKNTVDKRESIKERDWQRDKSRILRERG